MPSEANMVVKKYLARLKETRKDKPSQVRDALDIYLDLWEKAIKNGTVSEEDEVGEALAKLEEAGGLYEAAET